MPSIYGLDAAAETAVNQAREIAQSVIARHADDVDTNGRYPSEAMQALAGAGFYGLMLPKDVGGMGQGPRCYVAVAEELGKVCASTAMCWVMHTTATMCVANSATLADKAALLKSIAAGKTLGSLAATEAGSRSQFWYQTSQLQAKNGGWTLSATKRFVTSSRQADFYVAMSRQPNAQGPSDLTTYLIHRQRDGVKAEGGFNGLGLRGNDSAPVTLDNYQVSEGDLLAPHGEGLPYGLMLILPYFNLGCSGMAHGLCIASIEATSKHLSTATFEHDGSMLRDLLNLRQRLAEMQVRTDQSRALTRYALDHLEEGSPATPLYLLELRLASVNAAVDVTDLAMKACGGAAFAKHLGVERRFRDARAGWVMAPTADATADFIGKALLGLDLFTGKPADAAAE